MDGNFDVTSSRAVIHVYKSWNGVASDSGSAAMGWAIVATWAPPIIGSVDLADTHCLRFSGVFAFMHRNISHLTLVQQPWPTNLGLTNRIRHDFIGKERGFSPGVNHRLVCM